VLQLLQKYDISFKYRAMAMEKMWETNTVECKTDSYK
jgi:hypothetical protein